MRKWMVGWALIVGLAVARDLAKSPAAAASPRPTAVSQEMIIIIPHGRSLAIFQQVLLKNTHGRRSEDVGVLSQARDIRGIGVQTIGKAPGLAEALHPSSRFSLRYLVPWDTRSSSLSLVSPAPIHTLIVLTEPNLTLPQILNPVLAPVGQGRIPNVSNSPTFDEYVGQKLGAGTRIPIVLEGQAAAPAVGTHPRLARVFELLMGLAALGAIVWATRWKPAGTGLSFRQRRLLSQLASLTREFYQGTLDEDRYRDQRHALLSALRETGLVDG